MSPRSEDAHTAEDAPLSQKEGYIPDLARFIKTSPTSWHAADRVATELVMRGGFEQLTEQDPIPTREGGYVIVRDGAVLAWYQPDLTTVSATDLDFRILGAHTDSPTFRLKPTPDFTAGAGGWSQIGVEVYGGPLVNSWLDRDLAVAGRVITADGQVHLVHSGKPVARIPQLAIHLDRSVNDGLKLDRQRHLQPIIGLAGGEDASSSIVEALGLNDTITSSLDILGADLMLVDTQEPALLGANNEFFAAGRMDNLVSVHAGLKALITVEPSTTIPVLAAFDHEEVGSDSRTGAGGPFLDDTLRRILDAAGASASEVPGIYAQSWLLSADCGHLVHPNYPERHDPHHHPVANGGPMLKVNAQQRYTTDGVGQAAFTLWARYADVPHQVFVSNNAMPCGSTIGPIASTRLGIPTVDVGVGLLSMHSARELVGARDPQYLARLTSAFFSGTV